MRDFLKLFGSIVAILVLFEFVSFIDQSQRLMYYDHHREEARALLESTQCREPSRACLDASSIITGTFERPPLYVLIDHLAYR